METLKESTLHVLTGLAVYYKRGYVFPSQDKILKLIAKRTGRKWSRSWLNEKIKELENEGYLTRQRRHKNDGTGKILLRSTLYILRAKFYEWIYRVIGRARKWWVFFRVHKTGQYKEPRSYVSSSSLRHFSGNKGNSSILGVFEKCERQSMTGKSPPD
jgi:hypothetical protein